MSCGQTDFCNNAFVRVSAAGNLCGRDVWAEERSGGGSPTRPQAMLIMPRSFSCTSWTRGGTGFLGNHCSNNRSTNPSTNDGWTSAELSFGEYAIGKKKLTFGVVWGPI